MLTGAVLLVCLLLLLGYFAPAIIAICRHVHHWLAIAIFDLFFGWSGILWILALIMALVADTEEEYKASLKPTAVHIYHHYDSGEKVSKPAQKA